MLSKKTVALAGLFLLASIGGALTMSTRVHAQDPLANESAIDALESTQRTPAQNAQLADELEKQAQEAEASAAQYRKTAADYKKRTPLKWGAHAARRFDKLADYYEQLAAQDRKEAVQYRGAQDTRAN